MPLPLTYDQQINITLLDKGLLAGVTLIAGVVLNWVLERLKSRLAIALDGTKTRNTVVVDLIKALASASNKISWISWSGTGEGKGTQKSGGSLTKQDFFAYDKEVRETLGEVLGLQASVAAFDSKKFSELINLASDIANLDKSMGEARDLFLNGKVDDSRKKLDEIYSRALIFDGNLIKVAKDLKMQHVDA